MPDPRAVRYDRAVEAVAGGLGRLRRTLIAFALSAALAGLLACPAAPAGKTAKLALGDVFVARGQTGIPPGSTHHAVGLVVVRGRWNGGVWTVLTTTRTDAAGHYRFAIKPRRRGVLTIRISPPDEHVQGFVLHVS